MQVSVESICNELTRAGLLPPQDVRAVRQRWLAEPGPSETAASRRGRRLAAHGHITDYQAAVVLRRCDDPLCLGGYHLLDRIGRGPMAGVYKGRHPNGQVVAVKVLPPRRPATL